jgi:diamine N-acetyltransferase
MNKNSQKITFREITRETLKEILELKVTEYQNRFVASNAVSIAQAHFTNEAWFRGIYADDTPVGFIMMYINPGKSVYYLWRFMLDHRFQRMGYGRQAIQLMIEHVRTFPGANAITLSYAPGDGNPGPFYRSFGFVETGEIDDGEYVMKLKLE